ncbi:hypothetical protein HME9302_01036 [Alteripontixanthobacter maritimus]|uniref:DUF4329 domain-containing protein n=1 Tax=Alteripontixanthobacter maritimus TaxID=2161824 RepID=A0A369Q5Y3_9SPHN|nr:DUF4329 domain-containing protein [Alteripontixanthobacter maritimus]RDC59840.1 hypothetical protein HME9302_01036 [Alteripontixanthobacter maritimus]
MKPEQPARGSNPVTPVQIIVPLAFGAVVYLLASLANRAPEPMDWTKVPSIAQLEDETARVAAQTLADLQVRSHANNLEYCGYIYRWDGSVKASSPEVGNAFSCESDFGANSNREVLATYHTHAGFDAEADSEVPSDIDLRSTISWQVDDYVSTPGGRLWLVSGENEQAVLLCGPACLAVDPAFRDCPGDASSDRYDLAMLRARARTGLERC